MENTLVSLNDRLDTELIDNEQYTVSLINQALNMGLVTNEFQALFQMQLLQLFDIQVGKYTRGESSSISMDKGKEIIQAILFTADTYLRTFGKPSASLEVLKEQSLKQIYDKGISIIRGMLSKPGKRLRELQRTMLPFQNEAYQFTINHELPEYLKEYNVLTNGYQSPVFMYPLAVDTPPKAGIYGVYRYIINLSMENRICSRFDTKDIMRLLQAYNRMYKVDHTEMILNYFDIIIKNAIFAASCLYDPQNLVLLKEHVAAIHKRLMKLDDQGIARFLDEAVDTLISVLNIDEIDEQEYINSYKNDLLQKLIYVYKELKTPEGETPGLAYGKMAAAFGNYLDIVLFKSKDPKTEDEKDPIVLTQGKRLDDRAFSLLAERVDSAETSDKKAVMMKESIQSIYDYMDILNTAYFSAEDYRVIFEGMEDIELAALCFYTFRTEIQSGCFAFSRIAASFYDKDWEKEFAEYVKELPEDMQERVAELIPRLRI